MPRQDIFEEFRELSDEIEHGPMEGLDYPEGYFEALVARQKELATVIGALQDDTADEGHP